MFLSRQFTSAGGEQSPFTDVPNTEICMVKAFSTNAATAWLGGTGVTNTTGFPLDGSDFVTVPSRDLLGLRVNMTAGDKLALLAVAD